jgi:hypothetical protein
MNSTVVVFNSFDSTGDSLYSATFNHLFNFSNLGEVKNVSIKVNDFNISDINTDTATPSDIWRPNQCYTLTADIGQLTTGGTMACKTYLASKFYQTTYARPSCYTSPVIKLGSFPSGLIKVSVVNYRNEPVRMSSVKNIGNINVVATLYYDNV